MVGDSLVLFLGITSSSTTYAAFVPAQWAEAIVFFAWLMVHFLATFLYSWVMGLLLLSTWASLFFSSMLREFNSFHLKWLWFLNKCFFFFFITQLWRSEVKTSLRNVSLFLIRLLFYLPTPPSSHPSNLQQMKRNHMKLLFFIGQRQLSIGNFTWFTFYIHKQVLTFKKRATNKQRQNWVNMSTILRILWEKQRLQDKQTDILICNEAKSQIELVYSSQTEKK